MWWYSEREGEIKSLKLLFRWCIISTVFGCGIILHKVFFFPGHPVSNIKHVWVERTHHCHLQLRVSSEEKPGSKDLPTHRLQTCNVFRPNICIYIYHVYTIYLYMYVQYIYIEYRILNAHTCVGHIEYIQLCMQSLSLPLSVPNVYLYLYLYLHLYLHLYQHLHLHPHLHLHLYLYLYLSISVIFGIWLHVHSSHRSRGRRGSLQAGFPQRKRPGSCSRARRWWVARLFSPGALDRSRNRDLTIKNRDLTIKNRNLTIKNRDLTIKNRDLTIKNRDLTIKNRDLTWFNQSK